ncbi:MAG: CopD family protein [Flavobacteriales bacterium]|nr:CopD family protein [Flavobacteriales bacterium]HRH71129.1 CopD family protein [Flavobacteriales bacterium]
MEPSLIDPIPSYLKALELFALVVWFAGTFHIVRLFVAHRDAMATWEPDRTILTNKFSVMEHGALFLVIWPAMLLMILLGGWMLYLRPDLLKWPFMHVFLGYMALLLVYHGSVHRLHRRMKRGEVKWSVLQLRAWAQGATLLLFFLILLVVLRARMTWVWGAFGLLVLGAVVMFIVSSLRRPAGAKDHA